MATPKTHSGSSVKFFIALFMMGFLLLTTDPSRLTAQAANNSFYVNGTTIYDANGNPFEIRGVNIAHAWYPSYTKTSIEGAAALGVNTVRIVLANGQQWNKTSYSEVSDIINWCKENKLICILEVHDATGSDSTSALDYAVNYWIEMKDLLNANTAYVIVNVANEWYGSWNGSSWASGCQNAIRTLRNAGINNMLMIDCAGWGQYPDSIRDYGKQVFQADSHANTVFSIHMYEYAGGNASTVKNNINNALGTGVPVVIGEFGSQHSNGDVDEYTIMSYCKEKGVGYLGWSWKGNSGGLEYLDIANSWDGSGLSSWGNTLFYDTNGIKNTSKLCTVYTNSGNSTVTPGVSTGPTATPAPENNYYVKLEFEEENRFEQNGRNKVDSSMFSGYSGNGYVYLVSGWSEVGFTVPATGKYKITLVSNADCYKENWLYLDNSGAGTLYTNGNSWSTFTAEYTLSAGTHKFGVSGHWGYTALDYVIIEAVN